MSAVLVGPIVQRPPSGEATVLLASPRSFCAGVQRAIETVERALKGAAGPVYVRKQIVHNTVVVAELADRGAIFVDDLDEIPDPAPPGAVVVFSAHGVSPAVHLCANERGLHVLDATCPLVAKVHTEAARFAARGDTIILIGHAGHEETEGTLGVAPQSTLLVETPADVAALDLPEDTPVSYLTQTTLALDETAEVIEALRARFPALSEPPSEDICYATTNRQRAVASIVDECDVVLVIGSRNSSNSQRLVELAQRSGTPAYLIDGPDDIRSEWLVSVSTVGVTAGASAPPRLVEQVVDALRARVPITVVQRSVTTETVRFALPKQVRTIVTADTDARHDDLLAAISGPRDVQNLPESQLLTLAAQMRRRLIETVTTTGGHLGAGLGTVELSIALHRVFTSPHDVIVFDTGHQTYPHKLLTGRSQNFSTLRQGGGLSGYPDRGESPHDWVENSHASVSLAWVDGIAKAFALQGHHDRAVIAVIGDGALTGGAAWEGLNNLGAATRPVIVVLNDNARSYDPTTGAIAAHLKQLRGGTPNQPNLFETMGFAYIGPIDGHNISDTCAALRHAAAVTGPVVVHTVTIKGRGYSPAEADENDRMHACGVIDAATGQPTRPSQPSWTDVFENEIVAIADEQLDIVGLTAAMRLPTGLGAFSRRYPNRVFDSGIAEQHLLASAAGLAIAGTHPVVALYSTFLHRAFDQLLLDIGLHQLPVTLVLDRAGVTGPDGPSHHGLWDLALLACVPGLQIACPRDTPRLQQQLRTAVATAGPTALRFPKGPAVEQIPAKQTIGNLDLLHIPPPHQQRDVLLIAVGAMSRACLDAAQRLTNDGIGVTVVDPQWVWPLDPALTQLASQHQITMCVEDAYADAGIGTHLNQHIGLTHPHTRTYTHALPPTYIPHASRDHILASHGLTGPAINTRCQSLLRHAQSQASTTCVDSAPISARRPERLPWPELPDLPTEGLPSLT